MVTRAGHSPDGAWWWTGSQWLPAWSPDRRWWFDGTTWQRQRRPTSKWSVSSIRPRRLITPAAAWLTVWLVSVTLAVSAVAHAPTASSPETTSLTLRTVALAAVVWLVGMVATGIWCGRVSRFQVRQAAVVWLASAAAITLLLLVGYVVSMSASSDPGGDTAAGAGVVIFAIPAFVLVLVSSGIGLGVAFLARLIRHGRHERVAA
jgi:hypothetical protein